MPDRAPALVVLAFVVSARLAPGQTSAVQPSPLVALNDAFRAAYTEAKSRTLAVSGPVLIVSGDNFTLLRNGRRTEANAGASIYDPVKTIAHIPLAIYVILTPGDGAVDDARLKTLAGLGELILPAQASLDSLQLPASSLARQKRIVAASQVFLQDVTASRKCERPLLLEFMRGMAPLVLENVAEAAHAQLDAVHTQVSAWRRVLTTQEWNDLRVLVIGPHMPREDLVVMQYFLRLFHEPKEGRRIVYAESLWEEPKALDLLATHLLDSSIGDAFFRDGQRMHSDLLGEAAKQYIPHLLP